MMVVVYRPALYARDRLTELNRRWRLGRIYLDEHGALNASTGMRLAPLDTLAELLAQIGHAFLVQADGAVLTQRFLAAGERDFVVELGVLDSALLCMRARRPLTIVVRDPSAAWHGPGRLNQRFAIGSAVLEGTRAYVQLALPLRWTRLDTDLARWLIDRAHAALAAVDREVTLRDEMPY
jgi:hypothetical protein